MSYLILTEDSIMDVLKILIKRIFSTIPQDSRPSFKYRLVKKGDMTNPKKIKAIFNNEKREISKIFVLRDSECTPFEITNELLNNRLNSILNELSNRLFVCIVNHAIETWLLCDEQPLKDIFRTSSYNVPTDIENSVEGCHPKKLIRDEFRKHNIKFDFTFHSTKIASSLNLDLLGSRSRSFRFLREKLLLDF